MEHMDDAVEEYLRYRNYKSTLSQFYDERRNKTPVNPSTESKNERLVLVERIINAIIECDYAKCLMMWDRHVINFMQKENSAFQTELLISEFYLNLNCATHAFRKETIKNCEHPSVAAKLAARNMTIFKQYISNRGKNVLQIEEFGMYKQLPKVAFPPTHPQFSHLFEATWVPDAVGLISLCLKKLYKLDIHESAQSIPLPKLYQLHVDNINLKRLQQAGSDENVKEVRNLFKKREKKLLQFARSLYETSQDMYDKLTLIQTHAKLVEGEEGKGANVFVTSVDNHIQKSTADQGCVSLSSSSCMKFLLDTENTYMKNVQETLADSRAVLQLPTNFSVNQKNASPNKNPDPTEVEVVMRTVDYKLFKQDIIMLFKEMKLTLSTTHSLMVINDSENRSVPVKEEIVDMPKEEDVVELANQHRQRMIKIKHSQRENCMYLEHVTLLFDLMCQNVVSHQIRSKKIPIEGSAPSKYIHSSACSTAEKLCVKWKNILIEPCFELYAPVCIKNDMLSIRSSGVSLIDDQKDIDGVIVTRMVPDNNGEATIQVHLLLGILECIHNILISISDSGFNNESEEEKSAPVVEVDVHFQLDFIDHMLKFVVSVCKLLIVLDMQSQGNANINGSNGDDTENNVISYFHSCPDEFLQIVTKLSQLLVYCGYYSDVTSLAPDVCKWHTPGVIETAGTAYSNILLVCIKYILACPTIGKNLLQKACFKISPVVAMVTKLNNNSSNSFKGQYDVTRWCASRISNWGRNAVTVHKNHPNNSLNSMQQRGYLLLLTLLSPSAVLMKVISQLPVDDTSNSNGVFSSLLQLLLLEDASVTTSTTIGTITTTNTSTICALLTNPNKPDPQTIGSDLININILLRLLAGHVILSIITGATSVSPGMLVENSTKESDWRAPEKKSASDRLSDQDYLEKQILQNWNIIMFLKSQYETTLDKDNDIVSSNLPSPEKVMISNDNSDRNPGGYYNSNIMLLNGFIIALLKNCELIQIRASKKLLAKQQQQSSSLSGGNEARDGMEGDEDWESAWITDEDMQQRIRDRNIVIELTLSQLMKHYT